MPENLGAISATKKQSIARVELFTDADRAQDDWRLVIHFEDALYDADDALIPGTQQFGSRRVERRFGDIKNDTVTAASATVTIAQLAALIAAGGYNFRAADIAGETP